MTDIKQAESSCPCCGAILIVVGDFNRGVDLLDAEMVRGEQEGDKR